MRICLFDWHHGGHDAAYMRAFARAASRWGEVVAAAPDVTLAEAGDRVRACSLGAPRPRPGSPAPDGGRHDKETLAEGELDLVERVVADVRPDHLVLLYADPVLRWLVRRPALSTQTSICIHFAQSHFRRAYGTRLGPAATARAAFKDLLMRRWARRRDARVAFFSDEEAARLWRHRGISARWLPEPPLDEPLDPRPWEERRGAFLFGYLDARKGLETIAEALRAEPPRQPVLLAGEPAPEYRDRIAGLVEHARSGGASVDARLSRIPGEEAMRELGRTRCALLSFGWVPTGSRVLLEAAASGAPVLGTARGTIGHLIRTRSLGIAVDPTDPRAIGRGIRHLTESDVNPFAPGLAAYAAEMGGEAFGEAVRAGLRLG